MHGYVKYPVVVNEHVLSAIPMMHVPIYHENPVKQGTWSNCEGLSSTRWDIRFEIIGWWLGTHVNKRGQVRGQVYLSNAVLTYLSTPYLSMANLQAMGTLPRRQNPMGLSALQWWPGGLMTATPFTAWKGAVIDLSSTWKKGEVCYK